MRLVRQHLFGGQVSRVPARSVYRSHEDLVSATSINSEIASECGEELSEHRATTPLLPLLKTDASINSQVVHVRRRFYRHPW